MMSFLKFAQYEPETPAEHVHGLSVIVPLLNQSGCVCVLAYIDQKHTPSENLLQLLFDSAHKLASTFTKDANPQHRFETFLSSLNETIAEQVRQGHIQVPLEQFHSLVSLICEDKIILSGTGELTALFLHRQPDQKYQIFNLFRSIQTEQALPTWEKPYAVVLDGDFVSSDVFCVSHRDLLRFLNQQDLHEILINLPPKSAINKIRSVFPAKEGLLLSIIRSQPIEEKEENRKVLANASMNSFKESAEETEKYLEDSIPKFQTIFKKAKMIIFEFFEEKSRVLKDIKRNESLQKQLIQKIRLFSISIIKFTKHFVERIKNQIKKFKQRASIGKTILQNQEYKNIGKQSIKKYLSKKNGIILIIVIICLFILYFSFQSLKETKRQQLVQKNFQESLVLLDEALEQASGSLIYKDEQQARTYFQKAQTLIESITTETNEQKNELSTRINQLQESTNILRHVVLIPNPIFVGDLSDQYSDKKAFDVGVLNDALVIISDDGNTYRFDQEQKIFFTLNSNNPPTSPFIKTWITDDQLYGVTKEKKLYRLKKSENTYEEISSNLIEMEQISDILSYNERLYVLGKKTDSSFGIYRLTKSGDVFSSPNNWIQSSTSSFDLFQSLSIDGSLYITNNLGQIRKFESGNETSFTRSTVEPETTEITKIFTNPESSFLYLLEPNKKRVLVFKKDNGQFVMQYTSDQFSNLKSIWIKEKDKSLYLLSDSKIFLISLLHLNP